MTNKSMKPTAAQPRPMTEEERKAQALRAFLQERKTYVMSAFAGICRADGMKNSPEQVAIWAVTAADELMKQLYTRDEQAENTEK